MTEPKQRIPRLPVPLTPLAVAVTLLCTGCYTSVLAPGAAGKVLDIETLKPVPDTLITLLDYQPKFSTHRTEGKQESTLSDERGRFELSPLTWTQFRFMYLRNPTHFDCSFSIAKPGYEPQVVSGIADRKNRWRVRIGKILLRKSTVPNQAH